MKTLLYSYDKIEQITLLAADKHFRRWLDAYHILHVIEGKGELSINEQKVMLEAGAIYVINSGQLIEIHSIAHADLYFYLLSFHMIERIKDQEHGTRYLDYDQVWLPDGEIYPSSYLPINSIMKKLCALEDQTYEQEWKELEQQRLLYELLPALMHQQSEQSSSPADHRNRIAYVISYMQEHYKGELSRDAMAKLAGFHPRFFTKVFKEETGENFIEYLTNIRIRKAKELLLLTTMNLDAIAQQIGYSNGLYLSRKFKQHTGMSPTQYAKSIKRIVVYDWVGNVLALGIKPIGASYFYSLGQLELLQHQLSGVTDVGRSNMDAVIALEPELIIVPKWLEPGMVNELQKVAPTIIVPYGNPFERFKQLAELLDRRQEADAFMMKYNQRAAAIKKELATIIKPHETVGLYELSEQHIWVFNEFHGRGGYNLYEGMGFSPPPSVQQEVIGKGHILRINPDQLPDYAADHMIISYNFDEEGQALAHRWLAHPIWSELAAYTNNRIYMIDRRVFHANDVYSLYQQLELQRHMFLSQQEK